MSSKKTTGLQAVIDEMVYLSNNDAFIREVKAIRKKYKMPKNGIEGSPGTWIVENLTIEEIREFEQDYGILLKKCRGLRSKYIANFLDLLKTYILTGKITPYYDRKLTALMEFNIDTSSEIPVLKIHLDFDTSPEHIYRTIKANWRIIKKSLEKLGGKKLVASKYLDAKIKLWKLHKKKGKTLDEIQNMLDPELGIDGIKVLPKSVWEGKDKIGLFINDADRRIKGSFK